MFIIVAIILVILLLVSLSGNQSGKLEEGEKYDRVGYTRSKSTNQTEFKRSGLRKYPIRGLRFKEEKPKGYFVGYVVPEFNNTHDKYAVMVLNEARQHLGYVPRGNLRLFNYLVKQEGYKSFCWGCVGQDSYNGRWFGAVNIPTGIDNDTLRNLKKYFRNHAEIRNMKPYQTLSETDFFHLIDLFKKQFQLWDNGLSDILNKDPDNESALPKQLIISLSIKYEDQDENSNLVRLGNYPEILSKLSDQHREAIERRIQKAQEKMRLNEL